MLYQEIRPDSFNQIAGNRSTVSALRAMAKKDPKDRPHTILLSGPSGCGKTTLGRILAKEFGSSESNIIEIDAADVRGIDGVRSIKEEIQFSPLGGGSTTYIIDECHRLTKDAQSALLKCTEDTPLFVNFILCTTNPEQMLGTLKNRCAKYTVERLKSKDVLFLLKNACSEMKSQIDPEILEIIAENCDGCPRSGLVILEKILGIEDPDEIAEIVVSEIESKEGTPFFDFCKMLLVTKDKREKNWKKILCAFDRLEETDSEKLRFGILGFMKQQLFKIEDSDIEYVKDVARIMSVLSSQNTYSGGKFALLTLILQILFC